MNTEVMRLDSLSIGYQHKREAPRIVGENLNAVLREGELVFLLGPNGAGKSTLMRTICGMQKPLAGRVLLHGRDVHQLAPRDVAKQMAVVLTERLANGMFTGYELVSMGRHPHTDWRGRLTDTDHQAIHWALSVVRSEDLADRAVSEMSDGERQRILLARALAQEPQVLILDEITAFLDVPRRVSLTQILLDIVHREKKAVLLSSHDLDLALRVADCVWLYPKGGEMSIGMPEELAWSGALSKVFDGDGVRFDPNTGSFQLRRAQFGTVQLQASGPALFWTQRALERNGYSILCQTTSTGPAQHFLLSTVVAEGDPASGMRWRVLAKGSSTEIGSLPHLIEHLHGLRHSSVV